MKKSKVLLFALALIAVLAAPSFGQAGKITILFMPGVLDPFYTTMEKGVAAKCEELKVNLIVAEYPKAWGPEAQIPILEATAARGGIDAILIAPTDVKALIAPLRKLYDKGIEIVTVDTFLGDGDYSKPSSFDFPLSYIGSDNELGGRQMAEHLAALVGEKGKVFCQATNPDASSVAGRVKGFTAGIAQFPAMQLIGVEWCQDVQQVAQEQTLAKLQQFKDIVGIFGVNVFSAQGSYQSVVNAGLTGAVKICSWDATTELIGALRKGQVDLVLAQKPGEMGSLGVEWAVRYLKDRNLRVPKKIIPGFEFFTRDNVDDPRMQQFIYQ